MDYFTYKKDEAYCEDVPLAQIAKEHGTPVYVYSAETLRMHCRNLKSAFASYPTLPCFAVKANSNIGYLKEVFAQGFGADLVSIGELERALLAGVKPEEVVFSGVGKKDAEIERALEVGIGSYNVESRYELERLGSIARYKGKRAKISLRINPNIDAKTNPKIATGLYTTKFGLAEAEAFDLLRQASNDEGLEVNGLACHIGSQITDLAPLKEAAERMATLSKEAMAAGHRLSTINMGGGLGIRYRNEEPPRLDDYAKTIIEAVKPTGLRLVIEPGRVVAGNTGVLVSRVIGVKGTPERTFVVVDAAMNDLVRPTMYGSFHDILPVVKDASRQTGLCDIVGPICETGDFLGKDRDFPIPRAGDLVYVRGAGAYAASMASNYNSRPRAPEVMVDGSKAQVVRRRETLASLWAEELA